MTPMARNACGLLTVALLCTFIALSADARLVRGTAGTSLDNNDDDIRYFITTTLPTAEPLDALDQFWAAEVAAIPVPRLGADALPCFSPGTVLCGYAIAEDDSRRLSVQSIGADGFSLVPVEDSLVQVEPTLAVSWRVLRNDGSPALDADGQIIPPFVFEAQPTREVLTHELILNDVPPGDDYWIEVTYAYSLPENFAFYSGSGVVSGDIRDFGELFTNLGRVLVRSNRTFLSISAGSTPVDVTPPVSSASASPAPGPAGWNNTAVTVTIQASDETGGSGLNFISYEYGAGASLSSGSSPISPLSFSILGEGEFAVAYFAADLEGNAEAPKLLPIRIDLTNPLISAAVSPTANAAGWNRQPVTVSFTCTDALSGVDSCTPATVRSSEGAAQSVTGTAADRAGNTASVSVSDINIDLTAPTIQASRTPAPNAAGWNTAAVTVSFTCTDALSGVDSCTPATVRSSEGAAQSVTGTATDRAGNTASVSVDDINIDSTAPQVSITGVADAQLFTLGTPLPEIACETTDALSGVASSAELSLSGGTPNQVGTFTATCGIATDIAGNASEPVTASYRVAYAFSGFGRPIYDPPVINRVRAGQAVPVKFSIGGNFGLGIMSSAVTRQVACPSSALVSEATETTSAGGSTLSYDPGGDQYIYVWKTERNFERSCRVLEITLDDGETRRAFFEFR